MTKAKRPTIPEAIDRLTDDMFDCARQPPARRPPARPAERRRGHPGPHGRPAPDPGSADAHVEEVRRHGAYVADVRRRETAAAQRVRCRLIAPETVSWPQPGRVRPGLHPEKNKTMLYVVLKPFVDQGRDYRPGDTIELSPVLAVLGMHGPVEDRPARADRRGAFPGHRGRGA